jgi:hypothetical protein
MMCGNADKLARPCVVYRAENCWFTWTENGLDHERYNHTKACWFGESSVRVSVIQKMGISGSSQSKGLKLMSREIQRAKFSSLFRNHGEVYIMFHNCKKCQA